MFKESAEAIEQLQQLRAAFAASLPDKLAVINVLWQTVKQQSNSNSDEAIELYRAVHSLAGAAGSFGQQQVGNCARDLEQALNPNNGRITVADYPHIETELYKLKQIIQAISA